MEKFEVEGYVDARGAVAAVLTLVIGIAVVTLMNIFAGSLGAQVYAQVEPDISAISDINIQSYVKESITNSFKAQSTNAKYLNIIVLAVVIAVVMALVLGFASFTNMGYGGYGGVL